MKITKEYEVLDGVILEATDEDIEEYQSKVKLFTDEICELIANVKLNREEYECILINRKKR